MFSGKKRNTPLFKMQFLIVIQVPWSLPVFVFHLGIVIAVNFVHWFPHPCVRSDEILCVEKKLSKRKFLRCNLNICILFLPWWNYLAINMINLQLKSKYELKMWRLDQLFYCAQLSSSHESQENSLTIWLPLQNQISK